MLTEDYCDFETAKLLKEKGFDAKCRYYYIQTGEMFEVDTRFHTVLTTQELLNLQIVGEKEERCVAPTLQMAMKWLREVYHIHIRLINSSDESYRYEIYPREGKYVSHCFSNKIYYETYEEACEAACIYALKNLI